MLNRVPRIVLRIANKSTLTRAELGNLLHDFPELLCDAFFAQIRLGQILVHGVTAQIVLLLDQVVNDMVLHLSDDFVNKRIVQNEQNKDGLRVSVKACIVFVTPRTFVLCVDKSLGFK